MSDTIVTRGVSVLPVQDAATETTNVLIEEGGAAKRVPAAALGSKEAVLFTAQELSESEKQQARTNVGITDLFEPIYIPIEISKDSSTGTYTAAFDEDRFTDEIKAKIIETAWNGYPNFQIAMRTGSQYGYGAAYPAKLIESAFTGEFSIEAHISNRLGVVVSGNYEAGEWNIDAYELPKTLPSYAGTNSVIGHVLRLNEDLQWEDSEPVAGSFTQNYTILTGVVLDDTNEYNVTLLDGKVLYYQGEGWYYGAQADIVPFGQYDVYDEAGVNYNSGVLLYSNETQEEETRIIYAQYESQDLPEIFLVYIPSDGYEFDGVTYPKMGFYINKSVNGMSTLTDGVNIRRISYTKKIDEGLIPDSIARVEKVYMIAYQEEGTVSKDFTYAEVRNLVDAGQLPNVKMIRYLTDGSVYQVLKAVSASAVNMSGGLVDFSFYAAAEILSVVIYADETIETSVYRATVSEG